MGIWYLIILTYTYKSGLRVDAIEYTSKNRCMEAGAYIASAADRARGEDVRVTFVCTYK